MTLKKFVNRDSLHYVKYMGSKTKILPFVLKGIEKVYTGGEICDLFAGSCSLAGAIGDQVAIVSNDIQEYSSVLAKAYLTDWNDGKVAIQDVIERAQNYHKENYSELILEYQYSTELTIKEFNKIEKKSQNLIKKKFDNEWHLFTRYYSGTWWSTEQCTWIDSIRKAINDYADNPSYNALLSSLMYAAAYNSQGTGHYAQYRDAKTLSAMKDIQIYRSKSIMSYFEKKATDTLNLLPTHPSKLNHSITSNDYLDCLRELKNCTIYADPPYCFVHYSRFYHALETLVLYDYPEIQLKNGILVKGRYRVDRHQSPFCIKTQVDKAFDDMFSLIKENHCSLALSYSDTGMITIKRLKELALTYFDKKQISVMSMDYSHMTMGRKGDRKRDVKEKLLLIKQ